MTRTFDYFDDETGSSSASRVEPAAVKIVASYLAGVVLGGALAAPAVVELVVSITPPQEMSSVGIVTVVGILVIAGLSAAMVSLFHIFVMIDR